MSNRPVIAFFNNKGGVGKTSLVYHLAWMYAEMGYRVVAADLDPQANLTAFFLREEDLYDLYEHKEDAGTVYRAIQPLVRGIGDVQTPVLRAIDDRLTLLPGDLSLALFEDEVSAAWSAAADRQERAFRVLSGIWRVLQLGAGAHGADLVLTDLGPNLGALNRTALLASTHLVLPLAMDLFSLQGLSNIGERRREWAQGWSRRLSDRPNAVAQVNLPPGDIEPAGYIVMQQGERLGQPVKAYADWANRIPAEYHRSLLGESERRDWRIDDDPHCLGQVKHYRSLMPLAQAARKPIFRLTNADGALGAHSNAALASAPLYRQLAERLAEAAQLPAPVTAPD